MPTPSAPPQPQTQRQKTSLRIQILVQMGTLMTSGFGIVAALAWNDLIKKFFERVFSRPEDNLWAMLGYAVAITVIIVLVTLQIGRLIERAKRDLG